MNIKEYRNGWTVSKERNSVNGYYTVKVRNAAGDVHDKVTCDTAGQAGEYYRAFQRIAKGA